MEVIIDLVPTDNDKFKMFLNGKQIKKAVLHPKGEAARHLLSLGVAPHVCLQTRLHNRLSHPCPIGILALWKYRWRNKTGISKEVISEYIR